MWCRWLVLITLSYIVGTFGFLWFGDYSYSWMNEFTEEDRLVENMEVVFCFVASLLFFVKYWKDKEPNDLYVLRTRKNIFLLLIALGLFFVAGEEISWGQRILHVQTPGVWAQNNAQKELNIHNLDFFHSHGYLSFDSILPRVFLFFCLLVPLLNKFHAGFARFVKRINFPIVPIPLGVLYYIISIKYKLVVLRPNLDMQQIFWALREMRELDLYFLIMIIAVWFVFGQKATITE